MLLKDGKFYMCREGFIVRVRKRDTGNISYSFIGDWVNHPNLIYSTWSKTGEYNLGESPHDLDLIKELPEITELLFG